MMKKEVPLIDDFVQVAARDAAKKVAECCRLVEKERKRRIRLLIKARSLNRKLNALDVLGAHNAEACGLLKPRSVEKLYMFFKHCFFASQEKTPDAQKIRELEKILREIKR